MTFEANKSAQNTMERISVDKAKDHLDELLRRAQSGEDIVIADEGGRAVRLLPVVESQQAQPKRISGRWKGRVHIADDALLAPLSDEELAWLSGETSP